MVRLLPPTLVLVMSVNYEVWVRVLDRVLVQPPKRPKYSFYPSDTQTTPLFHPYIYYI